MELTCYCSPTDLAPFCHSPLKQRAHTALNLTVQPVPLPHLLTQLRNVILQGAHACKQVSLQRAQMHRHVILRRAQMYRHVSLQRYRHESLQSVILRRAQMYRHVILQKAQARARKHMSPQASCVAVAWHGTVLWCGSLAV